MTNHLHGLDLTIIFLYAALLIAMGLFYRRRNKTSRQFMIAGGRIPTWAAGLAIMSTYVSSISYIATPGKAYDDNWHPLIFALAIFPVAWFTNRYAIPYYRKARLISVYGFLEQTMGGWARFYASLAFLLYTIGRVAVILYLTGLLFTSFVAWPIEAVILVTGLITLFYCLLGGMEAVIWTDVVQSVIMIGGLAYAATALGVQVCSGPAPLIGKALAASKFGLGEWRLSLSSRTVWVMLIYGVSENLRNLLADQNYVQKYSIVATEKQARQSVWIGMLIYLPMTAVFLFIGTALYAFYAPGAHPLAAHVTKGDQVFPYYIATQMPAGLKGLVVTAILAAAMSTISSGLNCSATVLLLDFVKRHIRPQMGDRASLRFLQAMTLLAGLLGTGFALLMIRARSTLDVWWQISGTFGGGILGLFLLGLLGWRLSAWRGIAAIGVSIAVMVWGTFARGLPAGWSWAECRIDPILVGVLGTAAMLLAALALGLTQSKPRHDRRS